jgi:hypothetical protein
MLVAIMGYAAFWVGSLLFKQGVQPRFVPSELVTRRRVEFACTALVAVGVAANLFLWRSGLFGYGADVLSKQDALGFLQWLTFAGSMLTTALIALSIERFGKPHPTRFTKGLFVVALLLATSFGVVQGFKGAVLFPLVYVLLIYSTIKTKIPIGSVVVPLALILLIYPFEQAYRKNLDEGYRSQVNTLDGQIQTLEQTFNDAFLSFGANTSDARSQSTETASARLSFLTYIRDVVNLPSPQMLEGDEKIWLAPIYPLIPRFFWKDKPVFNKGVRLSIILGRGDRTSSAPTLIGDLFALDGYFGVVLGMFLVGIVLQLYMNWNWRTALTEKRLFIYISMLLLMIDFEDDLVSHIANVVQTGILTVALSYLIYGRNAASQT